MSIRANSRRNKQWVIQVVYVPDPPITSPAALALLSKMYFRLDKSIYRESRMTRIRNKWMKNLMKTPDESGGLTCVLCSKKGLKPKTKDKNKLATLDHIIELKCNGPWADPTNFQVACYYCNTQRK